MLSLPNFLFGGGSLRGVAIAATTMVVGVGSAFAQNTLTVKGTVKDAEGEPLIGANVRVQGQTKGASTDLNGDGIINNGKNKIGDMGDLEIIGDTTPRYQFTINGGISYKNLSLSFVLQGVGKRDWNPGGAIYFWGAGPYAQVTIFEEHLDYWREDNKNAYYPKPYIHSGGGVRPFQAKNKQTSDRFLQNAAYCRLKNLTLSYDLPERLVGKLGLSKAQIFFSGENLFTLTPLKTMYDPEAIFTGNAYTSEGGKNYPMNRVVSCGLILNL